MRVMGYARQGAAREVLELRDLAVPQPAAGEVLVRIFASGVNPHDTKARAGWSGAQAQDWAVPHSDGAGEIVALGAGVSRALGERVWLFGLLHGKGTSSEFVTVPEAQAQPLPEGISYEIGACLGVPALTAWLNVLSDGPVQDEVLVVQGGGGAVGEITVEMAVRAGACVFATSRSEAGRARALERGARAVFAPEDPKLAQAVAEASAGKGARRIVEVDLNANQAVDIALLADHGVVASYSSTSGKFPVLDYYAFARKAACLRFVQGMKLTPAQVEDSAKVITAHLKAGHLLPRIAGLYPLEETAAAHEAVEAGPAGNIVVTL